MAKYDSLYRRLAGSELATARLSFAELDEIVGGLPESATSHRAWWANETVGTHVQARSWVAAGYNVIEVVLGSYVVFSRNPG